MRYLLVYGGGLVLVVAACVLPYLAYLAVRGMRSLARARRCQNLAELAGQRQREGNVPEAVSLYLRAETAWALNHFDGSRDSWLRDLDLLATIGSGLVRSVGREPGTCYADFKATIGEMREVLKERRNFGVDGRRILPDVMIRWKASMERLDDYRAQLRQVCHPRNIRRI
jgi:hypothetical protein